MSCSRDTCWAIADVASAASAKPLSRIEEAVMTSVRPVSLVLDLQSAGADIDLQAFRFLLGLVESVAEHAHRDDQRADDEIENVAVAGHPYLHRAQSGQGVYWRARDSESGTSGRWQRLRP